jgi:two-component system, OmpR family, response regulator
VETTILIVDDSPYIVDGLTALLKRKGFRPVPCNGGEEALSILATLRPDLILRDIMTEPLDGWATLGKIKSTPVTTDLPVLMFSAKKITAEEAQEHCLNIEDFVSKPVNPALLLEAIQRVFDRRNDLKMEAMVAKDAGLDAGLIEEYSALRKSIEVDKNLLVVLKKSSGMQIPGRVIPPDELAAINKLDTKIHTDEQRLKEINERFAKGG